MACMLPSAVVSPPTATPSSLMSSMNTCLPPSEGISAIWTYPSPGTKPSVPQPRSSRATTWADTAGPLSPPARSSTHEPQPTQASASVIVNDDRVSEFAALIGRTANKLHPDELVGAPDVCGHPHFETRRGCQLRD